MKFGFSLSNNQGIEDVQDIFRLASRAEELGFDSVWASDHVFNVSYVYERLGNRPYYDPMSILSYVAAITKDILLGTSVLVLPYHNPMRLAKAAATLDVMSGGRLVLGVGVGVIEEELNAMGSPFAERGAITNETIAIMKELWTQEEPNFQGKYFQFSGMRFSPKPVQKPHIPLLIGGTSRAALRRAARMGDGWHPTALQPDDLAESIRYLHERVEAAGRFISEVPVSISVPMQGGRAGRFALGKNPEEILPKVEAFQKLGVERMVISPYSDDPNEMLAAVEMIGQHVVSAFA